MTDFLKVVLLFMLGIAAVVIIGAWGVMFATGMLYHEVPDLAEAYHIRAFGFRESMFISLFLFVLGSYFKRYGSSSKD